MKTETNFPEVIEKFDKILERGLCNGIGSPDGQMCIEAAISQAMGLPFGDDPECVAPAVRAYKIRLNDAYGWASPQSRAIALRNIGIAQIGSRGTVDEVEFVKRLAEKTIRVLIPKLFREIFKDDSPTSVKCREAADRCEAEGGPARYAAADADADAAAAADAARYAAAAAADDAAGEKYLVLSAELALEVLRELKSPGCDWIDFQKEK